MSSDGASASAAGGFATGVAAAMLGRGEAATGAWATGAGVAIATGAALPASLEGGATTGRDPRDLPGRGFSASIVCSTDGDWAIAAVEKPSPATRMAENAVADRTLRT